MLKFVLIFATLVVGTACSSSGTGRRTDDAIIKNQVKCQTTRSCNR